VLTQPGHPFLNSTVTVAETDVLSEASSVA